MGFACPQVLFPVPLQADRFMKYDAVLLLC